MRTLGFGYVCNGCGFSGMEPSWSQTWGYKFKKLDEVTTLGEAATYMYERWKQAKDIPAAKQAVEKYEEAYEKFEKQRVTQKLILSNGITYLQNWPEVKKLLIGAWEIRAAAENIGKEKEPPKEPAKNGKPPPKPAVTATEPTTPTALPDEPPPEGKAFPWWMVGVGAVGIGVVVLLLGMRKKATANPRYSPGVGQYIREEMHKIGKSPHVQSRAQALAVGLSRARHAGLKVPPRRNPVL